MARILSLPTLSCLPGGWHFLESYLDAPLLRYIRGPQVSDEQHLRPCGVMSCASRLGGWIWGLGAGQQRSSIVDTADADTRKQC